MPSSAVLTITIITVAGRVTIIVGLCARRVVRSRKVGREGWLKERKALPNRPRQGGGGGAVGKREKTRARLIRRRGRPSTLMSSKIVCWFCSDCRRCPRVRVPKVSLVKSTPLKWEKMRRQTVKTDVSLRLTDTIVLCETPVCNSRMRDNILKTRK